MPLYSSAKGKRPIGAFLDNKSMVLMCQVMINVKKLIASYPNNDTDFDNLRKAIEAAEDMKIIAVSE